MVDSRPPTYMPLVRPLLESSGPGVDDGRRLESIATPAFICSVHKISFKNPANYVKITGDARQCATPTTLISAPSDEDTDYSHTLTPSFSLIRDDGLTLCPWRSSSDDRQEPDDICLRILNRAVRPKDRLDCSSIAHCALLLRLVGIRSGVKYLTNSCVTLSDSLSSC